MPLRELVWHLRYIISVYTALCTQQWFRDLVLGGFILFAEFAKFILKLLATVTVTAGPSVILMVSVGYITMTLIKMWNSDRDI